MPGSKNKNIIKKAVPGRIFVGRLNYGDDLWKSLNEICVSNRIKAGIVQVIGAVQNAKLGYYDQSEKKYVGCVSLDRKLEIAACTGNVSMKDGEIFVHAHITLADYDGSAYGGHLLPETFVFAAEFFIQELKGVKLLRVKDETTGLPLWA